MKRKNLFDGGYKAQFAIITYRWLISRRWVTYADVLAEYLRLESSAELEYSVSKYYEYTKDDDEKKKGIRELKKAFPEVCNAIKERCGKDSIEEDGNNRNKRFRYVGNDDNPLADMQVAKTIVDLNQYWKFCQDSAGLMPMSWLEYFFKNYHDILAIRKKRQKGEQVISTSLDRELTNIEYLPMLYDHITNKVVVEIDYKPFYEEGETLIFHPHYLREYNGRWHVLGHAEGHEPKFGFNIALDRIQSQPREKSKIKYIGATKMYYEQYFNDIVGLTHMPDAMIETVIVRAHTLYMYNLTKTKRIHGSQEVMKEFGEYEDGTYGDFSLQVKVNNEFIGCILQMGAGLEIVSPDNVRQMFKERVAELAKLYTK